MKIVVLDGYATNPGDLSWEWLINYGDLTVNWRCDDSEIVEKAKDADIVINNKCNMTREVLNELPKLKYIGLQSTGYNAVDIVAAREKGIVVSNVPSYSTNEVAQHTFALLLEITNHIGLYSDAVHNGDWSNAPNFCFYLEPLDELNNKIIGIIGFGSIGKRVAEIAKAFGMRVLVNTPHPTDDSSAKFCSLDELLENSDIITCHCPLNDKTTKLINEKTISKMKKTPVFINTSRGAVVDDKALADALNDGRIKAAGLDVLTVEPPKEDNPLLHTKNCYITPHIAWGATQTRARLMKTIEENLKAFISGKPQNVVN